MPATLRVLAQQDDKPAMAAGIAYEIEAGRVMACAVMRIPLITLAFQLLLEADVLDVRNGPGRRSR